MRAEQWDYIVIGAGSAGCALAYELARSGEARVLVLESGGKDSSPYIKVPAWQADAIKRNLWNFVSQPDPTRNGKSESWARGRVLGGSSSINGMMYVRGAAADFNRWAAMGNKGWAYEDVLPLYREMERSDQVNAFRGSDGPLYVTTVRRPHPLTTAFIRSAVASGYPFNADYNGPSQEGVAYAQLSQRRGLRYSAARAYLKPLLGRSNLKLLLHTTVHRIELRKGRATGISFTRGGENQTAAARHIVVSAGAISSPQLLMLSGIGDTQELSKHSIETRIHSPEVGGNLQEHPLINLTYGTRTASNNLTGGMGQKLSIAWEYLAHGSGPVANLFEAAAFIKSSAQVSHPDIQLHFLAVGYTRVDGAIKLLKHPAVTVYVNKSNPKSRGCVRLASANSHDAPLIECRILEDEADVRTLADGVGVVRNIMSTPPMAELVEREIKPGKAVEEGLALETYIHNNTEIAFHPVGSCRMGADPGAVVNPELRVNGVENLWVADASVMPDLVSGNTSAVCMMIGMKLGRHLNMIRALNHD